MGHTGEPLLDVEDYLGLVLAAVGSARMPDETVQLADALGRVLAADQPARLPVPSLTNSAMDGHAIRHADLPGPLPVVADIPAGAVPAPLPPGCAARIMTGAPIPDGADTVVPLEDTFDPSIGPEDLDRDVSDPAGRAADAPTAPVPGGTVAFAAPVRPGQHVRFAGEDVQVGQLVLTKGTRLSARHLAAAAATGTAVLPVARRPRVQVIVTGDEIAPLGKDARPGQLPDANGPYLCGALTRAGAQVAGLDYCPDQDEALARALDQTDADLVVVSGGTSAGDHDVARDVLGAAGGRFVRVAMQPGKPQGCARWGELPVIALPGNPVSVAVSFAAFVRPALELLLGQAPDAPQTAVAGCAWVSPRGRQQYLPVAVSDDAGRRVIRPATAGGSGSHLIASLALADALAVIPAETTTVAEGDVFVLLDLP